MSGGDACAQHINSNVASQFSLTPILAGGPSSGTPTSISIDAMVGQMAFGPDGRLYVATVGGSKGGLSDFGVFRFDYSPTGGLINKTKVHDTPSTGLAFHQDPVLGTVMYITDANNIFDEGIVVKNGTLRRLTDTNGDGMWGSTGDVNQALVNNVPVEREHRMNQLQVRGDSLFVGIGSMTTDGHSEAAYTGTVGWIENLAAHSHDTTTPNLAGFDEAFVVPGDGRDRPSTSTTPLTSTDSSKLRVHSRGLRNAYGLALDADGDVWVTMNNDQGLPGGTPSDLFFKAQQYGNYGFPHEMNAVFDPSTRRNDGTPYTDDPDVLAAGFSPTQNVPSITAEGVVPGYNPGNPNGSLGPSAAVGGVDFGNNNGFALRWHKDAFMGRWVYQDVVAVDTDTGEVVQIAAGFNRVLDVVADPWGNLLVAEAPLGDHDRARVFRIEPSAPHAGVHRFAWGGNTGGNWSERLNWSGDFDGNGEIDAPFLVNPNDQMVPHQWGPQRYSVAIDRQVADLVITLDQDAHVESLRLGNADFYSGDNQLRLLPNFQLTVDDHVAVEHGGILSGAGRIAGGVVNHFGTVRLDSELGLQVGSFLQEEQGVTLVEIASASEFGRLLVEGSASLGGTLELRLADGLDPASLAGQVFDIFDWGLPLGTDNRFDSIVSGSGLIWDTTALYTTGEVTIATVPEPSSIVSAGCLFCLLLGMFYSYRLQSLPCPIYASEK